MLALAALDRRGGPHSVRHVAVIPAEAKLIDVPVKVSSPTW